MSYWFVVGARFWRILADVDVTQSRQVVWPVHSSAKIPWKFTRILKTFILLWRRSATLLLEIDVVRS